MANDERNQPDPDHRHEIHEVEAPAPETEPLAYTEEQPRRPVADEGRATGWQAGREPVRRHPLGAAVGAAAVGLLVGFLGGAAVDAHPMMSLTVGSTSTQDDAAQAPAPPPPTGGERGPGGLPWGPPPGPAQPGGRGPAAGEPAGPPPPPPSAPAPPNGEEAPAPPSTGRNGAPQPSTSAPLPAERPSSPGA